MTVVDLVAFEQGKLSSGQWALTASLIASCLLVAGLGDGVQASVDPSPVSVVAVLASATLAGSAAGVYLDGRVQGVALLAVAGLFGLLAVPVQGWLGRRNLASVLWLVALVLALAAAPLLVLGSGLVAAFAVGACALAAVGLWVREPRLQAAALAPLAGAVGYTLSVVATPRQLFVETSTPGAGAGALLLSAAACALCAWLAQPAGPQLPDRLARPAPPRLPPRRRLARRRARVGCGVVGGVGVGAAGGFGVGVGSVYGRPGGGVGVVGAGGDGVGGGRCRRPALRCLGGRAGRVGGDGGRSGRVRAGQAVQWPVGVDGVADRLLPARGRAW